MKLNVGSAALVLVNSIPFSANATQLLLGENSFRYRYSEYSEDSIEEQNLASGSVERYKISIHQFSLEHVLNSDWALKLDALSETMSGASPWYVVEEDSSLKQVMTGATIEESRDDLSIRLFNIRDDSVITIGTNFSIENDYKSIGATLGSSLSFNENNTTVISSVSHSIDSIVPTDSELFPTRIDNAKKNVSSLSLGVAQVINSTTLFSYTMSFSSSNGFLSDPYKLAQVGDQILADSRPSSREHFSHTMKFRHHLPSINSTIHFDYNHFENDWAVKSQTFDFAFYWEPTYKWMIKPSFRFYEQSSAIFYNPVYDSERVDGFYSSDYRLSGFKARSSDIEISRAFKDFNLQLIVTDYRSMNRDNNLSEHPGLVSFNRFTVGITFKY